MNMPATGDVPVAVVDHDARSPPTGDDLMRWMDDALVEARAALGSRRRAGGRGGRRPADGELVARAHNERERPARSHRARRDARAAARPRRRRVVAPRRARAGGDPRAVPDVRGRGRGPRASRSSCTAPPTRRPVRPAASTTSPPTRASTTPPGSWPACAPPSAGRCSASSSPGAGDALRRRAPTVT